MSNSTSTLKTDMPTDADSMISSISPPTEVDNKNLKVLKSQEKRRKLRDEIVFCSNLILVLTSVAIIFGFPTYFKHLNTLAYIVMFTHRLYEFHAYKWDFYLIDFCYVVNTNVIVFSEIFEESVYWKFWFLTAFGFSLGPILFSNFVFNFGFVFHNTVKFTSFFTHLAPGIVMFLARWYNETTKKLVNELIYSNFSNTENFSLKEITNFGEIGNISFITPGLFFEYSKCCAVVYLTWFVIYYLIIFKISYNFTEKNGFLTQFSSMMENKNQKKHLKIFGEGFEGLAFMFVHLRYVFGCLVISFFYLFSFQLGFITLILCTLVPIWNASTYYCEYFSKNYKLQFELDSDLSKSTPV